MFLQSTFPSDPLSCIASGRDGFQDQDAKVHCVKHIHVRIPDEPGKPGNETIK